MVLLICTVSLKRTPLLLFSLPLPPSSSFSFFMLGTEARLLHMAGKKLTSSHASFSMPCFMYRNSWPWRNGNNNLLTVPQ